MRPDLSNITQSKIEVISLEEILVDGKTLSERPEVAKAIESLPKLLQIVEQYHDHLLSNKESLIFKIIEETLQSLEK